jgi:S-adenosylmethionine:tRNA ribosyltransferase-isomerase
VERDAEGILTVDIACSESVEAALQRYGRVPIPPYLGRSDDEIDQERYESIFARHYGSVAAPTASLHLTAELLERLTERGIRIGRLVLHIGLATFRPVSSEELDDHVMHAEYVELDEQLAEQVALTRRQGGRVVAVGTSVVRALESAQDPERSGCIRPCRGETRLFIRPGYGFSTVDGLLTNFHQPKSTLLALVSAFAGRKRLLSAYAEAVAGRYRFLSYGDAMWIPERLR